MCEDDAADAEMAEIDGLEAALVDIPANISQVRALISRVDSLAHYKLAENLNLLLSAIASGSYPNMPAVDVLWRAWEIDDERREHTKSLIYALKC